MIQFVHSLFKQVYDPQTDILTIDIPSVEKFELKLVEQSINSICETVKNYNIKYLLLDASNADSAFVSETVFDMMIKLFTDLKKTNLEKLARVRTHDATRELQIDDAIEKLMLSYEFLNFDDLESAKTWLTKSDSSS